MLRGQLLTPSDPSHQTQRPCKGYTLKSKSQSALAVSLEDGSLSFPSLKELAPHSDNVARLVIACCWLIIAILFCKWSLKVIKGFVSCDLRASFLQGSQAVTNTPSHSAIHYKLEAAMFQLLETRMQLIENPTPGLVITQAWQGCCRPKPHWVGME